MLEVSSPKTPALTIVDETDTQDRSFPPLKKGDRNKFHLGLPLHMPPSLLFTLVGIIQLLGEPFPGAPFRGCVCEEDSLQLYSRRKC